MKERLKSYFLILLTLSTLYLTIRNWVYSPILLESASFSWVKRFPVLFGLTLPPEEVAVAPGGTYGRAAVPVKFSYTLGGKRQGWFYSDAAPKYERMAGLFGEALGTAQMPDTITRDQWQSYLSLDNVYAEYQEAYPLTVLGAWEQVDCVLPYTVNGMALCLERGKVYLLFADTQGYYFRAETKALPEWNGLSELPRASACRFFFESPNGMSQRMNTLLIPESITVPAQATVSAAQVFVQEFLQELSINPNTRYHYQEQDAEVYVENTRTVRVSRQGIVQYRNPSPDPDDERLAVVNTGLRDYIEAGRSLLETLDESMGDAAFALYSAEEINGEVALIFQPVINGVPVRSGAYGEVVFRDRCIVSADVLLKRYSLTDNPSVLLPPTQAGALLSRTARGLGLCYLEHGETAQGEWFAQ